VVTGSIDRTARVWDGRTGEEVLRLEGHANAVKSVGVSANGTRIVSVDYKGEAFVWDLVTGKRVQGEPVPSSTTGDRTWDGEYLFVPTGNRVLKVPTRIDEAERLCRLWLARPDPEWHLRQQQELLAAGNTYGAALHRSFEYRARGRLALEAGDFDRAWGYFIAAALRTPASGRP
jgi:WD40 repeat protein